MKAERRHELQTNTLADFLGNEILKYRQKLPYVIGGVAVLVLLVVAIGYFGTRSGAARADAWTDYVSARTPDEYTKVAERHATSEVALWAKLDAADAKYFDGIGRFDRDRTNAIARLKESLSLYQSVVAASGASPVMTRRAQLGEAACLETLGDREKAVERYRAIAKQYADSLVGKDAARRATDLESKDAADFYAWFVNYTPPTPSTSGTKSEALPEFAVPPGDTEKLSPSSPTPPKTGTPSDKPDGAAVPEKPAAKQPPADPKPSSSDGSPAKKPDPAAKPTPEAKTTGQGTAPPASPDPKPGSGDKAGGNKPDNK